MQRCVKDTGREGVIWNLCNTVLSVRGRLIISPLLRPACSHMVSTSVLYRIWVGGGGCFYLLQRVHIYTHMYVNMNVHVCLWLVSRLRCAVRTLNAEPPVCPACCFTCEPRCASAPLQLYSIFHSNLRDWELKARWTFFNNEGILCLQHRTWLTHAVCAALQFKGR